MRNSLLRTVRTLVFFFGILLFSCSQNKTCKYEEEYNDAAGYLESELEKNPEIPLSGKKFQTDFVSDMTHLSCSDYQREYKLSDLQLKQHIDQTKQLADFLKTFGTKGEYIDTEFKVEESK